VVAPCCRDRHHHKRSMHKNIRYAIAARLTGTLTLAGGAAAAATSTAATSEAPQGHQPRADLSPHGLDLRERQRRRPGRARLGLTRTRSVRPSPVNPTRPILHTRAALLPPASHDNGPLWLFRQHQGSIVVVRLGVSLLRRRLEAGERSSHGSRSAGFAAFH